MFHVLHEGKVLKDHDDVFIRRDGSFFPVVYSAAPLVTDGKVAGLVVVLITTMIHGLKPKRVRRIREALQIDSRTLKRWRQWWLDSFVHSSFWKAARARFMPPLCERTLPLSLWLGFELEERHRLLAVLEFLRPITTPAAWKELAM